MARREVRADQHGTVTGYSYGCRCDGCAAAKRSWRQGRLDYDLERQLVWRQANREYHNSTSKRYTARLREASRDAATVAPGTPWQPHEDALLSRIASNIAAASALGRTYASTCQRRRLLRTS